MKMQQLLALAATCLALTSTSLTAQTRNPEPLAVQLTAQKVETQNGKETLGSAEKTKPGDTVLYTARYENKGAGDLRKVRPVLPIPAGMHFTGQARPAASEASLDGKTFETLPIRRSVKTQEGLTKVVEVTPDQYRALRWAPQDLKPQQQREVSARVQVNTAGR